MSYQRQTYIYIKDIENCDNGKPSSVYTVKNNCMRIGYFEYITFETSVSQSRNFVLHVEYGMANKTLYQQIYRHERFIF